MGAKEQIKEFLSRKPEIKNNMDLYDPNPEIIKKIESSIKETEIKVFTADWCPDCRIQLPRFFAVIMALGIEDFGLELFEVDRTKKDQLGMAEELGVMAIPTFIFFRNGNELGRIIERPKEKMEGDISKILE